MRESSRFSTRSQRFQTQGEHTSMALSQSTIEVQLSQALEELQSCRAKIARLRQQLPQPAVHNYTLTGPGNTPVSLASLFGEHEDMIVIHNMGVWCAYCTLWADGFNGFF